MKKLAIIPFTVITLLYSCSKTNVTPAKTTTTTTTTPSSYVADQVTVYSGISNYPSNTIVNGPIATAEYAYPQGMALDASGNLYVTDWLGGDIRKITPAGIVSTYATGLHLPAYLAVDGPGNVYFTQNQACAEVSTEGHIIGLATLNAYQGITADNSGNIFVATQTQILKLDKASGSFSFYAGDAASGTIDGAAAKAKFSNIRSLATDKKGNIFAMDGNSIRIINTLTDSVKTLTLKVSGSPFALPQGIAVDEWDNIYVVNDGNPIGGGPNEGNGYILKITPDGTVSNFAGNQQLAGDAFLTGPAQSVAFDAPNGIVLLPSGDFLVSTIDNVIKKITTHKQ